MTENEIPPGVEVPEGVAPDALSFDTASQAGIARFHELGHDRAGVPCGIGAPATAVTGLDAPGTWPIEVNILGAEEPAKVQPPELPPPPPEPEEQSAVDMEVHGDTPPQEEETR